MPASEAVAARPAPRRGMIVATAAVLLLQALTLALLPKQESVPPARPLATFPTQVGAWTMIADTPVEAEVQKVLRADETLNRSYRAGANEAAANLFVAFYKSQRSGVAPHSPKNCLPGSGWLPTASGTATVDIPGVGPVTVNRYIVQRGPSRSLVLYWYQTSTRVVASEYLAKIYLVLDAILHNRSDTSIVRVVVNLPEDPAQDAAAEQAATQFIQSFFGVLKSYLPG